MPLDGSGLAEQSLPYARLLTSAFKVPVDLLNVYDSALPQFADPDSGMDISQMTASYQASAVAYLTKAEAGLKDSSLDITVDAREGTSADQIIRQT